MYAEASQKLVVLNFFRGADGELRCRASDAFTKEQWIVPDAWRVRDVIERTNARANEASR